MCNFHLNFLNLPKKQNHSFDRVFKVGDLIQINKTIVMLKFIRDCEVFQGRSIYSGDTFSQYKFKDITGYFVDSQELQKVISEKEDLTRTFIEELDLLTNQLKSAESLAQGYKEISEDGGRELD